MKSSFRQFLDTTMARHMHHSISNLTPIEGSGALGAFRSVSSELLLCRNGFAWLHETVVVNTGRMPPSSHKCLPRPHFRLWKVIGSFITVHHGSDFNRTIQYDREIDRFLSLIGEWSRSYNGGSLLLSLGLCTIISSNFLIFPIVSKWGRLLNRQWQDPRQPLVLFWVRVIMLASLS